MSDSTHYKYAKQYEDNFDPKAYLEAVFNPLYLQLVIRPELELQHKAFMKYGVSGERVLDVGSGPCVHSSLVPAQYLREIYLSDYVSRNRQVLTDWLEHRDKAYDMMPLTQHVARLYGNVKPPGFYEDSLRQRIKGILQIDILLDDPLQGQAIAPFDCITNSSCFEGACSNLGDFEKSVKNLLKYLKPNGYFFHKNFIRNDHYFLGDVKMDTLSLTSDKIMQAFSQSNLKPLFYEERSFGNDPSNSPIGAVAGMAIGLWVRKSEV